MSAINNIPLCKERNSTLLNQTPRLTKLAYTVKEVAGLLSLGRTTLYEKFESGELRALKCGRKTLILAKDIQVFLDRLDVINSQSIGNKHAKGGN